MYSYYKPDAYPDLALRRQPVRGLGSNLLRFECVVWLRKCVGWFGFVVWFKCLVSSVLFWIWMCCCECVAWFEHVASSVLFGLVALFRISSPEKGCFLHKDTILRHYSEGFGDTIHFVKLASFSDERQIFARETTDDIFPTGLTSLGYTWLCFFTSWRPWSKSSSSSRSLSSHLVSLSICWWKTRSVRRYVFVT